MVSVRRASCDDAKTVATLLHRKYNFSSVDEASDVFEYECQNQHYRIAEEDGRVVGLISWRPQGTMRHGVVELTRIAVLPDISDPVAVKEVLFDVMVAEADHYYKQHASRLRKIFSMIHADNRHVQDFFVDKGMSQEAVLRNHFRQGQDEHIYSLFLA